MPLVVVINGKAVNELQKAQAVAKSVTLDVSINGKLLVSPLLTTLSKLEHPYHALFSVVAEEVLISGNLSRPLQSRQALLKLVPEPVLICGKSARLEQRCQA